MIELIIIIIVINVVVKNAKKNKGNVQRNNTTYASSQRRPAQTVQTSRAMTQTTTQVHHKPAVTTKSKDDGVDHSTTDYLHKKAMEDQREHMSEKVEERKRLDQKYGGRPLAMRYLPGDRIPHGMRIVYCPYCSAENLVETMRTDRACYFCRTKL